MVPVYRKTTSEKFGDWLGRSHSDGALLVLRLFVGFMMLLGHGGDKLLRFGEQVTHFPDPLGLGPGLSLILVIFAEFFCSLALVFGFLTRLAAIPLILTMLVAAFFIHGSDTWAQQEVAVIYLICYLVLFFAGPGRYSIDNKLFAERR
jgi:putative oxidoreductase